MDLRGSACDTIDGVTLNGWQRLWVLVTLMWTFVVGVVTWNTWPLYVVKSEPLPTLSTDALPTRTDATSLMNGVLKKGETLTRAEFAARLKAKYPIYADRTDEELVTATLKKFPEYNSYINPSGFPEGWRVVPDGFVPDSPETVSASNRATRNAAVRFALMLWLFPPVTLYALGFGAGWVYLGFRST